MKTITLILILFLVSCKSTDIKFPLQLTMENAPEPPGTIIITNNIYFDKREITNLDYLEYVFWTAHKFGQNSDEYLSVLPDTNVWGKLNSGYSDLISNYLKHPIYHSYPVVGVSYDQAVNYTNWRSDRVMEMLLVYYKIIPWNPEVPKDSIFTIEKYFEGKYYGINPDKHSLVYPHYSLPDSSIYNRITLFADSLNTINYKYCDKKNCQDKSLIECVCLESKTDRSISKPYGPDPTKSTNCEFCKKQIISHLKGNVREMTNKKGQYFGLSFIDSCKSQSYVIKYDSLGANSYTGFRNTCEWRVWKK